MRLICQTQIRIRQRRCSTTHKQLNREQPFLVASRPQLSLPAPITTAKFGTTFVNAIGSIPQPHQLQQKWASLFDWHGSAAAAEGRSGRSQVLDPTAVGRSKESWS